MNELLLGDSGATVSALCLGSLDNHRAYWLEGWEGGASESLLGRWMEQRGNHDELFLTTNVGASTLGAPDVEPSAGQLERLGA